ncbi:hypothetical protein GDO86_019741 [Hymenochirus boettgeri]|uniref:Xin actin-binding repeat-containing protein 2 n=1 Tax=Hymenochirus boettgeri TaxID=247094 RepID=A0A8T2I8W2_9PIPI|nr:hypothetical protein GDO86_019741 [Hymenochirus boettgeri]
MRWVFENQPLDSIKDVSPEPSHIKRIGEQEIIAGGDVKYTTWMFETKPIHALGVEISNCTENADKVPDLSRGDVRTATWLFETQPLDSMNKMYQEQELSEICNTDQEIRRGDVKLGKHLYETQLQNEINVLRLSSELQEFKGDVKRTIKHFETEPKYVLKDSSGNMLEIKTVCREDIEKGDVKTARWMFETQPLDTINHDKIQVVKGISLEESITGGVEKTKWLFETQCLDTIKEEDNAITEKEAIVGTDVNQKCWIFETVPMDMLKDNANEKPMQGEEIVGGDVRNTKHLFETIPMDELKENVEVGKLKQIITEEDEKGDVRHQRWVFETKPLEQIREESKEYVRTVKLDEIDKGDVSSYRNVFERGELTKSDSMCRSEIEDITKGAVKLNQKLFETTPLYAIQDHFGHYHEVQTIRKEDVVRGDVRTCQWMFETMPIDTFPESVENYQLIKGISSEEILSGDVKTGKWLFETQPLDSIKYFSNTKDDEVIKEHKEIVKGDVKMCKWLFETQRIEDLYDKQEKMQTNGDIQGGDVKTCTWLFETQPLDSIQDESEKVIHLQTINQESIQGRDVERVCFLFETQNLESIQGEEKKDFKRVVEIDVQSGDVSSMKYIFENQPLDKISLSSDEVLQKIKLMKHEDLQNGNVLKCRWLFENRSIDDIHEIEEDSKSEYAIKDVQGGNVKNGCFIFETFSLDQIKDESSEDYVKRTVDEEEIIKGDVKNYTLMFETQPLYAIQDKEGFYHEVTTVKKEEVLHGNVRGTRWLFETKPLDSFQESNDVYVIKAVTQEDIQKGDVSSVRWRFETQSLDLISQDKKPSFRTIQDIQGGDVKRNKQQFEQEEDNTNKFVRTVSISEIKQGNVKTSSWLFETHTIDEIHGDDYQDIKSVTMEDIHRGDVKEALWLFENHNLDSIKDEDNVKKIIREEIPHADVQTTTWLFETTPLHEFNENAIEKQDIIGKNIRETLKELYSHKMVETHGIILEANEIGDISMAKYNLMNQACPEIQKEEIIKGDLKTIMLNLLSQNATTNRTILLNDEEKGDVNLTKSQLFKRLKDTQADREEIIGGDIQEKIKNLLLFKNDSKQGILIQESEKGDIKMTVYSLLNKSDKNTVCRDEVITGDIKRTINNLRSSMSSENREKVKIEDSERGNVQFYTTCIESGALDYLRQLQSSRDDSVVEKEHEEIIGGDVEGTKLQLKRQQFQIERTVDENDIIPGDVYNTVRVFMTESENKSFDVNKEEVVKGNLRETLNSLNQAVNHSVVVEKEEIIKADLSATLKSLGESQHQMREMEKPDVIPGDIHGTINSLEKAANMKSEFVKEEVIHGNLEAALQSLNQAQISVKQLEKENVIPGDIDATLKTLQDVTTEKKYVQHQVSVQGDVKNTIKSFMNPLSVQITQDGKNNMKKTKKDIFHNENEIVDKIGMSGETLNPGGPADNSQNIATGYIKEQTINALQKTEKCDNFVNHLKLKKNVTEQIHKASYQKVDCKDAVNRITENNPKVKKTETSSPLEKHNPVPGDQFAELISGEEDCLHQGFSEEHKEKTPRDIINQNKVMQKSKLSSSINSSKSTASQQAINVINGSSYQVSDQAHTQLTNRMTQNIQYSKKTFAKNQMDIKQAQVLDSINNNLQNADNAQILQSKVNMLKEMKRIENRGLTKKKSMEDIGLKMESSKSEHELQIRNYSGLQKVTKQKENPEINFPPPPSPPLPVEQPLSAQLPLPPPPPPLPLLKASIETEYFPSPPSPVTDKTDNEIFPPPSPEAPPPLQTDRDIANKKVSFLPCHEQQIQVCSTDYSMKQSGIQRTKPDTSLKSKLPVFHHKVEDMTVTNKNKTLSKQSKTLEHVHNVRTTQEYDFQQDIKNQGASFGKKKSDFLQRESPLKMDTIEIKAKLMEAKDLDQIICDQELENIHSKNIKTMQHTDISQTMSSNIETKSHETKSSIPERINEIKKEQQTSKAETETSQDMQITYNHGINDHDFDQDLCDREMERIHEEMLKPKKKVFFQAKLSPSLQSETPLPKPKTYVRKFKTPLMIAEEKYRQQKEEEEKMKCKTLPQNIATQDTESQIEQSFPVLEANVSTPKISPNIRKTSNNENKNIPDLNKQKLIDLTQPSNTIHQSDLALSTTQHSQFHQEQILERIQEYNIVERKSEQYSSSMLDASDKLEQLNQNSSRTISPSLQRMPLHKNIRNTVKPEESIRWKTTTENALQDVNKTILTKQEMSEECHRLHFPDNSQQSVAINIKEKESSDRTQTQTNESETKKVAIRHEGISFIRIPEQQSPKMLKKVHIKKEQKKFDILNQTTNVVDRHLKSPDLTGNLQRLPSSSKDLLQESKPVTENIVRDKTENESQKTEKKKIVKLPPEILSKEERKPTDVIECIRKCEELQQIILKVNTFESDSHTVNIDTFRSFLNVIPVWLINEERKKELIHLATPCNIHYMMEQLSYIKNKTHDMQTFFEGNIESIMRSSKSIKTRHETSSHAEMSQKQISATSIKKKPSIVAEEKPKVNSDISRVLGDIRQADGRSCSPSLKTRSPSPTYITIESTARRTQSPKIDRLQCPSPLQKETSQAPPPPRRSVTPKMPSRSEQLAKLKGTTAKLSHGSPQPRAITPVPVVMEKKCEIVHSPATLRRQLKIENQVTETLCTTPTPVNKITVNKVGEQTEKLEGAAKLEVQKMKSRGEPKDIPEWLSPEMEEMDIITHRVDIPKSHTLPTKDKTIYTREKGNAYGKLKPPNKDEMNKTQTVEAAQIQMKTDQSKFQSEQRKTLQQVKQKTESEYPDRGLNDGLKGKSRNVPIKQIKHFQENPSRQAHSSSPWENREHLFQPMIHSETMSFGEHISGVDKAERKVGMSRLPPNSETLKPGFEFKHAPPTYEDVISGHMLDISATDSPDDLLKNFQKTWEESERVFKSLGYSVSDTSEMRSSYHQEEYITGKEA